ncbi:MAG: hypothetical protein ACWA5P_03325, partial [bacterium]
STHHKTKNYIKKMIVDSNGIAHIIIEQIAWWWGKDSRGRTTYNNRNFRYYYMTYNSKTQYKSSPKVMFETNSIDNGNLPDEGYRDFIMNGNTPILLTSNSTTNKVKRYILSGGNVQASSSFTTNDYASGSLVNYKGKTYIVYLVTDSIQANERLKRKEVYPTLEGSNQNIVGEYLGRYYRIHNNKIYFYQKGILYQLNDDMTVDSSTKEDIGLQTKYIRGKVKIYDANVREVLLDKDTNMVLLKNDGSKEILFDANDSTVTYNKMIVTVYDDSVIAIYIDKTKKLFQVNVYNRNTKTLESTFVGNRASSTEDIYKMATLSSDGELILGNPDGVYDYAAQLVTADLSNGLSSVPSIDVEADTVGNIGDDTTIRWSMSKESDKLSNFKVYKVGRYSTSLLETIEDTSVRMYNYVPTDVNEKFVTIKIVANYNDGESSSDQVSLQVLGNVSFNTFNVNKTELNLFESLKFTWSASGVNSNNSYTVARQCSGEKAWIKLFDTKETEYLYKVRDFSGNCQFKVSSGESEKVLEVPVTINGDVFRFKDEAFSPSANYESSGGIINFDWDTYFEGKAEFKLYVKKDGENDFSLLTTTFSKHYATSEDFGSSFKWKVSFVYNGQTVESKVMNVTLSKLDAPRITMHQFVPEENNAKVSLTYSAVSGATSYEIYKSQYGNNFEKIGSTSNLNYDDTTVNYGESYSYYVVALKNEISSLPSEVIDVSTSVDETYEVIMETANYQNLSTNEIVLRYRPDKTVSLERYEILLGTNINELYTYDLTNNRELTIGGLEYGKRYYIEVYPLNSSGKRVSTLPAKLVFITGYDSRIVSDKAQISIDEVAQDHVSLSWDDVLNADSYTVCRSENSGPFECLESVERASYIDSINLEQGAKYRYIVKAKNGNGFTVSDVSKEVVPVPMKSDLDNDGIPDDIDPDIDGDGVVNLQDAFPRDASEWLDTDGDGIGNNADTDDDNDGILDVNDAFPLDKNEWLDTDHDGIGNNADTDDDNDGISDKDEVKWGFDPLDPSDGGSADADGDGVSNADEIKAGSDPLDPNDTKKLKKPKKFAPIIMDDMMIMVPLKY